VNRRIIAVTAMEILDSRGYPTLRVFVDLADGMRGVASVPAGASTGREEAKELRDGPAKAYDRNRYGGRGVRLAIDSVQLAIAEALRYRDPVDQAVIDQILIELDGTPDKSRLGANAILGASMAVACAAAKAMAIPLYAHLGGPAACYLPVPMMNVINGGQHADNTLDFQEFMIVPHGAGSYGEALRSGTEIYHALKRLLGSNGYESAVGDEGGFAPNLRSNEEACALIVEAIGAAGYEPGRDVAIALDPAASSFWSGDHYELAKSGGGRKNSSEMTALYAAWVDRFPIVSIEDGLAEGDWDGFRDHTAALGDRVQIVGDDLYVTNAALIARGAAEQASNAVLIKPNQIGTVTETVAAIEQARSAGWRYVISHRSGETDDTFIADLAVAMGGRQIKAGAPCRGERVAKYNRLLEIERELGAAARFESPFRKAGGDIVVASSKTAGSDPCAPPARRPKGRSDKAQARATDLCRTRTRKAEKS